MRRRLALRCLALAVGPLLAAACAGASAPDLVIRHAKVFTNDAARPWAEAVAIKGERVVAVGGDAAIGALAGASTRVIDAGGRVLVPGFNDARVDLPLRPPTPQDLTTLDREAVTRGVTSLQVVAGGPMKSLVVAAQQAQRAARWRLIRSPEDTSTLSTSDPKGFDRIDEKPYLPPQPGVRLVANGVAWQDRALLGRHAMDPARRDTVVRWAYGAEDPIVMAGDSPAWIQAVSAVGLAEVWRRKRPRLDVVAGLNDRWVQTLARQGIVLTVVASNATPVSDEALRVWYPLGAFPAGGVIVAVGSRGVPAPMASLAELTWAGPEPEPFAARPLSREDAVRAMTWGSAYAEKGERDKGWLAPGTLADIAVLSGDIFTAPAERLPAITSVLTLVGGTIVYDPGVLTSR
jgi:imidazolonepropionase-like amidohydrolase